MDSLIAKAATLTEALPYMQKFRGSVFVFKYGGHAMKDPALEESFVRDLILLKHVGIHPIIVHGGGPQIEHTLKKMGIDSQFSQGLRVTDAATMQVVEMVLVGSINSRIVGLFNKLGGMAAGFAGCDGRLIMAKKMATQKIDTHNGPAKSVDLGFVGEITKINPEFLIKLAKEEMCIPVVSPIGMTEEGQSLNINADTVSYEMAKALKAEKLILLTDVAGVLDKSGEMIHTLTFAMAQQLIDEQTIKGGMVPKVLSAIDAIKGGVASVSIIDGHVKHAVLLEIFTDEGVGTLIHA